MRFTRRLRERWTRGALALAAIGSMVASCSSEDDARPGFEQRDGVRPPPPSNPDAKGADAASPVRDAGPFDAAPLPVSCESAGCATSLVTTTGISSGEGFCVLLGDGTVACWGANGDGQLGRGEDAAAGDSATPARVLGLSAVVALDRTCAVDKSGGSWCWGRGPYLRSATLPLTTERSPVKLPIPRATKVSVGFAAGCALVDDGILCWGRSYSGQVPLPDGGDPSGGQPPQRISVPSGAPIRDIVLGQASFARREDGTVLSWGANPPLGRISPLFPDPYPQPMALDSVSALDVIATNACAIAGGVAYCWGRAVPRYDHAQNYDKPQLDRAFPKPVVLPEPVVRVATTDLIAADSGGSTGPTMHPPRGCASGTSGAVYCWGHNSSGQAGDGTTDYKYDAVRVTLPGLAADVKTTESTTCALLTTGKVYCWGGDYFGQLGGGRLKNPSLVPQEVTLP
jgi:Regulator of chromosome condensation (RCC1) repeat